uniref:CG-1 domain-containing protein n=2 Tax=Setaria viridis TaxID=4556 RepID=A0A4U6TF59_SETVI|nr:hypothetical protein SEVIR_8G090500v2 [Setaria viridis]TKW00172.1 hypothetical protein SEVIR_8G090500v2 [Setaria viridis]TKW00173.1 hypothetical protein SEVIR_8G090500v2 [Setaria viridis]
MHKLQQVVMKTRWLKPQEVLQILRNHELFMISHKLPQKPPSGSWFLINRRVLRYFRNDGFEWQKKENGKSVNETHERLKVDNMEALNCYYARGDKNPTFQRRIYWMLDPAYEHIVLLHYRDVPEGSSFSETARNDSFTLNQNSSTPTRAELCSSSGWTSETPLPFPRSAYEVSPRTANINNERKSTSGSHLIQHKKIFEKQLSLEDQEDSDVTDKEVENLPDDIFNELEFSRDHTKETGTQPCHNSCLSIHEAFAVSHGVLEKSALSIQKNFRCWKRQKEFLKLRKYAIKIQAQVRANQERKKYMEL